MIMVTCGMDLAKKVIHIHGIDEHGEVTINRQLKRSRVLNYFAKLEACLIGIEACGGAHYWARELTRLGHTVRMMNPQHVKPYVKGNKNDSNDAAGICEAVTRPSMRFVGVKTIAQQDILLIHRIRSLRVKTRTALVNQIRGLLAEYGHVIAKGVDNVRQQLVDIISESTQLSERSRQLFYGLYEELLMLDDQIQQSDQRVMEEYKRCEVCQRLATLPGIGLITATALVAYIGDIKAFKNGRELAAYFGLVPRQHSSGGKPTLLGISKRGDSYIRTLLIHGARAVQRFAPGKADSDAHSHWLYEVEQRRGKNKAAVAQANKTARRVWALLSYGTVYQPAA
jgi:transposase